MYYVMAIALAAFVSAPPALASMELSDKYECSDCHRLELKKGQTKKKKEGPTYREIAEKYKGKKGIEKQLVGNYAAKIRSLRPPEPYKGKGIRYANENVRRKEGKTGKK